MPDKKFGRLFLIVDRQPYDLEALSVSLLVRWCGVIKLKSGITSVLDTICVCLCVWDRVWGVDGGCGCRCPPVRNKIIIPRHLF